MGGYFLSMLFAMGGLQLNRAGWISLIRQNEIYLGSYRGRTRRELEHIGTDLFNQVIRREFMSGALEILEKHGCRGDLIVLVSATTRKNITVFFFTCLIFRNMQVFISVSRVKAQSRYRWNYSLSRVFLTEDIMQIGGVLEVILLSISLGDRINEEKRQLIIVEKNLSSSLEKKVKERTMALNQALENLEVANVRLDRISRTDSLTRVSNRRAFDDHVEMEYKSAGLGNTTSLGPKVRAPTRFPTMSRLTN